MGGGAVLLLSNLHMSVNSFVRVISCEEGKALAESWNAAFMESSAKENQVGRQNFASRQTDAASFVRCALLFRLDVRQTDGNCKQCDWRHVTASPVRARACVCVFDLHQTAVEVFRRMILEAEKMDGGVQPGKTSCSMM